MAKFHDEIIHALQQLADSMGEVAATYQEIALAVRGGANANEVHRALIDLKNDGKLPGRPTFTNDTFYGRAPGGGGGFRARLKAELRKHADKMNRVAASYADIASAMGASADQIHHGIVQLKDDGYFGASPIITSDFFEVRLPDKER